VVLEQRARLGSSVQTFLELPPVGRQAAIDLPITTGP
jgi:hypothetical protein